MYNTKPLFGIIPKRAMVIVNYSLFAVYFSVSSELGKRIKMYNLSKYSFINIVASSLFFALSKPVFKVS